MIIYKITNTLNNKIYVGQTRRSLSIRFKEHIKKPRCKAIYNAIQKYGKEFFIIEEIERVKESSLLDEREQYWITYFNCISPLGYNLTSGGTTNKTVSVETRNKLSNYMKQKKGKNHPSYGHKMSEEVKQKLKESNINRVITEETRAKMSNSAKNNKKQLGKIRTNETKTLLSKKLKGNKNRRRAILCFSEEKTQLFDSITEASNILNISRTSICNVLNGWSKSAGGFIFKYKGENQ